MASILWYKAVRFFFWSLIVWWLLNRWFSSPFKGSFTYFCYFILKSMSRDGFRLFSDPGIYLVSKGVVILWNSMASKIAIQVYNLTRSWKINNRPMTPKTLDVPLKNHIWKLLILDKYMIEGLGRWMSCWNHSYS